MTFKLISPFTPQGDQPSAIRTLVQGVRDNMPHQVLLGVTGSGKTFTMASVIEQLQMPTLVISPNKTLAAQLYQEFKSFFPNNAVHYFVSYYDYYQPEAYLPITNTYIQKDARINAEIDKLRHTAIQSTLTRKDVIIIASVSCIYGVGDPENYKNVRLEVRIGQTINPQDIARHLNLLQYIRNDKAPMLGEFSVSHKRVFIHLVTDEKIEIVIEKRKIKSIHNLSLRGVPTAVVDDTAISIFPAKLYVTPQHKFRIALSNIKSEMEHRVEELQSANKFVEAERLENRTTFDLEMLRKRGYVNGIENYSRHLSFRQPGDPPVTLIDYFPKPFLTFIDESHIATPQLRAMQESDRRRKSVLVSYGFRLPSALDNRPLSFAEFENKIEQTIYVSATPSDYEMQRTLRPDSGQAGHVAEQLVRPTGILDPTIIIKPAHGQVRDLLGQIIKRTALNERVLALTMTKRSAEDLTEFLIAQGIRATYLHSEIKTLKRPEIIKSLRTGEIDVLVGINLLREGLDLPEVTLVAILDADREGFLRNHRGLMQMAGRAARAINGEVILYADTLTDSIRKTVSETKRRRKIQTAYNKKTGAHPMKIIKSVANIFST